MDFGVVLNRIDITSLLQQPDHKDAYWEKNAISTASTQHKFPMSENSTAYAQHIKINDQPLDHTTLQNSRQLPHTDVPTAVFSALVPPELPIRDAMHDANWMKRNMHQCWHWRGSHPEVNQQPHPQPRGKKQRNPRIVATLHPCKDGS